MEEEVKKLREQVARLTDQLKDQREINQFLRKINGALEQEKCKCNDGEKESKG